MLKLKLIIFIVLVTLNISSAVTYNNPLKTLFEWKQLDFLFPTENDRQEALSTKSFIPENSIPLDTDVHYRVNGNNHRVFITIPKFMEGVPITLGTVSSESSEKGPLIQPYPDYSWHKNIGNCDGITSVFRVMVDQCNRLWALDTGRIGEKWLCPPQLLAFDLNTDRLLIRYRIPEEFIANATILVTPVVDVIGTCFNTKVYMADVYGYAMIVYDLQQNRSWRIKNPLFNYDSKFTNFTISGESFDINDGIVSMAFKKFRLNNFYDDRMLYFHSLASDTENAVPLRVLNDGFSYLNNENAHSQYFREIGKRGTQSAAEAMDSNGNLFFGLVDSTEIACWDSDIPYEKNNFRTIEKNSHTMQFASAMKVVPNLLNYEELWVLTNRLQKFFSSTMNWDEINFRVHGGLIQEILGGPKCRRVIPVNEVFQTNPNSVWNNNLLNYDALGLSPNYNIFTNFAGK